MGSWVMPSGPELGIAAAKAALMYGAALVGLRVAHRRTLAQWTAIDFAAAVAVGAIVGRTAIAGSQTLLVGVVALFTVLLAHFAVTLGRYHPVVAKLTDHRVRVLVAHGRVRQRQMLLCGLTENDLIAQLRQQGVRRLGDLRYVLYETKGELTVVPEGDGPDEELIADGLHGAIDPPVTPLSSPPGV